MAHSGLLSWANSVRLTMASDPGRQAFKDQVQSLGFLFLDDYLDNILSGAKQDPLIELVKTPGRKKVVSTKIKPGPSKLSKSTVVEDGENNTPLNSFQKALLSVKADADRGRSPIKSDERGDRTQRPALRPVQPHVQNAAPALESTGISFQFPPPLPSSLEPSVVATEHNELSVIAEDEEPSERSQPSTSGRETEILDSFPRAPMSVENTTLLPQETKVASTSDMDVDTDTDTFHSMHLALPFETEVRRNSDPRMQITSSNMVVDSDAGRLSEDGISSDRKEHPTDLTQEDNTTTTLSKAADKPVSSSFPTLPEPMPLRKSTRLRDPSTNTIMLGAATPGAATGKRTSWLAKAREVKALEGNGKKLNAQVVPSSLSASNPVTGSDVLSTQGTKRKSEKMLGGNDLVIQEERVPKVAKLAEGEIAPRKSKGNSFPTSSSNIQGTSEQPKGMQDTHESNISEEGVLDMLKKTVQGLGLRAGKTMGKSLGGDAATALAEAKAAAEARLAERDRRRETTLAVDQTAPINPAVVPDIPMPLSKQPLEDRASLSNLFPRDGRVKEKHKAPEKVFHKATPPPPAVAVKETEIIRLSTSTTPPNSPPLSTNSIHPVAPVFTKLAPVFVPPIQVASRISPISTEAFGSVLPLHNIPSSMVVGFGTKLPSSNGRSLPTPLTAQSTIESVHSEAIFDQDDTPAWMPGTQDTEYTAAFESQSQPQSQVCDEDDSWPVDEKLAAGVQWTYGVSKEDSMTWSTLPSQSQRADTGPVTRTSLIVENDESNHHATDAREVEDEDLIPRDEELEEIVLGSMSTVNLVKQPELTRSQSQSSMAFSESSQSHTGFFGQASKFLSSALGTSKKKPEVKKVLQMAAAAAKKQQEEADKKAVRLKEMEMRRQQAIQRKAEEEKAKAMEEERKMKEDADRRRREKEDQTNKQPFKPTTSKREDDTKKRKFDPSPVDKKAELKKPAPSVLLGKSHLKHALKQAGPSGTHVNPIQATVAPVGPSNQPMMATPMQKKNLQVPQKQPVEDFSQPSQLVQSQMAARAKAQIEAFKPTIPSESIELPDINSEYSDSEDEDRPRTYDPPDWAQSPELRQALQQQSTINPDDIFGAVRPLKMEEIFKTKKGRFRARSSSANWTGTDRLTVQEELEYARRMGFK